MIMISYFYLVNIIEDSNNKFKYVDEFDHLL